MWEDRVHGLHYTATNTPASATILGGDSSTPIDLFHNPTTTILPWAAVNPSAYSLPPHHAPLTGEFYHPDQADLQSGLQVGSSAAERLLAGLHGKGAAGKGLQAASATTMSIFGSLHAEFGKMSAKEILDAKALAASKSHSEAERRRRQRINAHLAKLRSLLPNTTKTDKASLLAEVIEHVKELKRQTAAIIAEEGGGGALPLPLLPTEADELTVDAAAGGGDEDGRLVVRASLCCDDRSDLIPDLARALKSLKLRARRAEIATLGGRVKNVLIITGHDDDDAARPSPSDCVASIRETLRAVVDKKTAGASDTSSTSGSGIKRQRTNRVVDEQQGSI